MCISRSRGGGPCFESTDVCKPAEEHHASRNVGCPRRSQDHNQPKNGRRPRGSHAMYEFCFSLPYGALLALGGAAGYFTSGSAVSLAAGGGSGALILFFASQSHKEYKKCREGVTTGVDWEINTKVYTKFSMFISAILTYVMGRRHFQGGKFMPAGLTFYLSLGMSLFYLYRIIIPAKRPNGSVSTKSNSKND